MQKFLILALLVYQTSLFAADKASITALNILGKKSFINYRPYYTLHITKVDGKNRARYASETLWVFPGYHQIEVECSAGNLFFAKTTVFINVQAEKKYNIVYPSTLKNHAQLNWLSTPKFIPNLPACRAVRAIEVNRK